MFDLIFWICFASIFYIYFGYPLLAYLVSLFIDRSVEKRAYEPPVTIVIPAYNEEHCIRKTIENKLALTYPQERREIIVVSDGSSDDTDKIVDEFWFAGVKLLRQEQRKGKTLALNRAVKQAGGEIIVFSDANSLYSEDALLHLVANFSDESVGYVTGKMVYRKKENSAVGEGCSAYMMYENFLREAETRIGSVVGVDGGIDAVKKSLYEPMKADQLPDFILPLKVIEKGYRVVYDPAAISSEEALNSSNDEYRMRVRVGLRSFNAIRDMRHLMNPLNQGVFAWQLISHKMLRYLSFIFLILIYFINYYLVKFRIIFSYFFIIQNLFYLGAIIGWIIERKGKRSGILYIPFYFCLLNLASAKAFLLMLMGERKTIWDPRKG